MSALERLLGNLDRLVDSKVGIIKYVAEADVRPGAPSFFHYAAKACNTQAFVSQWNFSEGGGAASNREVALAKAIGECIERYCSAIFDLDELPVCSYKDTGFECAHPSEFALYTEEQYRHPKFPWRLFTEETSVRWAAAYDLTNNKPCHVPAAMVYLPYKFIVSQGDTPIVQPISTGLACGPSPKEAVVSAICEVIERDAFMITWQNCLAPPVIRYDSLPLDLCDLVDRFTVTGSRVTLFNITMDHGIPTVLAVQTNDIPSRPAITTAASSSPDPVMAARKSLEELVHTYRYMSVLNEILPAWKDGDNRDQVIDQESHLRYWCTHKHAYQADFLFQDNMSVDFDEIPNPSKGDPGQDLRAIIDAIDQTGHRVLVCDVTSPDIREMGLTVMRAVVPGYHPLFMGYHTRALGGTRLWSAPEKMGYERPLRDNIDNPAPHPYP